MTETSLLQGEITENPSEQDLDVEGLLLRFVRALVEEQIRPGSARVVPSNLAPIAELAPPVLTSARGGAPHGRTAGGSPAQLTLVRSVSKAGDRK